VRRGEERIGVLPGLLDQKAGGLDRLVVGVPLSGAADTGRPEIGVADYRVGQLTLGHDVGDRQPAAEREQLRCFGEHLRLVRREIDDSVGDRTVEAGVRSRQPFDPALAELALGEAAVGGERVRLGQLLRGEVHPRHPAGRPDERGGVEDVGDLIPEESTPPSPSPSPS
jgi:hypothetical protein